MRSRTGAENSSGDHGMPARIAHPAARRARTAARAAWRASGRSRGRSSSRRARHRLLPGHTGEPGAMTDDLHSHDDPGGGTMRTPSGGDRTASTGSSLTDSSDLGGGGDLAAADGDDDVGTRGESDESGPTLAGGREDRPD